MPSSREMIEQSRRDKKGGGNAGDRGFTTEPPPGLPDADPDPVDDGSTDNQQPPPDTENPDLQSLKGAALFTVMEEVKQEKDEAEKEMNAAKDKFSKLNRRWFAVRDRVRASLEDD